MKKDDKKSARPFARSVAQELSPDEIDMVAGGDPGAGKCIRTLTGVQQHRDGSITHEDTDTCPSTGDELGGG